MESIKKLEDQIEKILKPLPHLPADARKWLGTNIWWLTIIGVVIDGFALLSIYNAATVLDKFANFYSAIGVSNVSGWTAPLVSSLALLAVTAVLMAMAISPLKESKKKGWDLLFLAAIVGVLSSVVSAVLNFSAGGIVSSLIGAAFSAAVSAYFLFEIRSQFNGATVIAKK
ncbi:MAG: hypothetical protein WCH58_00920 [Candidatus Saccharibacteria bacterium]